MPNDKKTPASASNPEPESLEGEESLEGPETQAPNDAPSAPAPEAADILPPANKRGFPPAIIINNLYMIVFAFLLIAAGSVVYITLQAGKPNSNTTTKVGSLTSQQLASLKGNTTLVGDSKQTLDIQSNTIFEGQILARSDLNVAGTLKVGGPLSIPSINVGGAGTFAQVGISNGLNVAGDTVLQGALTIQKNLSVLGSASFGSLNVSSLSITTLQLKGDISLNQHVVTSGGNPGRSNGTALGGGGTATVSGSDTAGNIAINTGSGPPAGCFITINFALKFSNTPHIVVSASNSAAGTLQYYTTNRSNTGFSVCTDTAPTASTTYSFDYIVID
jgi:hypothetical protein